MTVPDEHKAAQDDLIERAAQVLCDSQNSIPGKWDHLDERFRNVFRHRARALADVGLLADPDARFAQRDREQARDRTENL